MMKFAFASNGDVCSRSKTPLPQEAQYFNHIDPTSLIWSQ
jgi:hypothetical protein